MKTTHNPILKIVLVATIIMLTFTLSACGKDEMINVTMQSNLYTYDRTTATSGTEVLTENNIEVGKRYKLDFNIDFTNLEEAIGRKTITVTMRVTIGDYDNDENIQHIESIKKETGGGIHFENKGTYYEASFLLSKDSEPDYAKSYFIVGVDSINIGANQPVEVTFQADDKEFNINSSTLFYVDLTPIKGSFSFDREDIIEELGDDVEATNILIHIPSSCGEIWIEFYSDSSKTERYGINVFNEADYADAFSSSSLSVVLATLIENHIGTERFQEWTAGNLSLSTYIVITAIGGDSYHNESVSWLYTFE